MPDAEHPTEPGDLRLSTNKTPRSTEWVEGDETTVVHRFAGPCGWCGKPTHCIDLSFEARLCPACNDKAWEEFFNA